MTGHEFRQLVELCGTQSSIARQMGVDPDTLRIHYNDKKVPLLYELAIKGIVHAECAKWIQIRAAMLEGSLFSSED